MSQLGRRAFANPQRFAANLPGKEAIYQPLYDFQTYAAAGHTSLSFFQVPNGQSNKTLADTNMDNAGALPAGKEFLVQAIEVCFFPGADPGILQAPAAAVFTEDCYKFSKSGHLQFFVGSKSYLDEAPIGVFGQSFGLEGFAALADSTTASATGQSVIQYAKLASNIYQITPVKLVSQQNFKVVMDWPAAVAISADARVGVRLLGTLYRNPQ